MPFNPCGRIVDYARREYTTTARFFRDSDIQIGIQWYRAADDAPKLEFPSAFMSTDWLDNGQDESWKAEVGEVWNEPRPYRFHGELIDPPYTHVCGTEDDFRNGATFDPAANVQYDEQGIPLCCELPVTPFAGVVVGAEAEVPELIVIGGVDCASATLFPVPGVAETIPLAGGQTAEAEITDHDTGDWLFTPSGMNAGDVVQVLQGPNCSSLSSLTAFFSDGTYTVPLVGTQRYWLVFLAGFGPNTIGITVDRA